MGSFGVAVGWTTSCGAASDAAAATGTPLTSAAPVARPAVFKNELRLNLLISGSSCRVSRSLLGRGWNAADSSRCAKRFGPFRRSGREAAATAPRSPGRELGVTSGSRPQSGEQLLVTPLVVR